MQPARIAKYAALPFIYLISALPFPLLYRVSDLLFLILYYGWRYRRKVVYENLVLSFPGKTDREITRLARRYYRYLCDLFLETFKMLTISSQTMLRRCALDAESRQLLDELFLKGKSAILTLGHKGNWEWAGSTFSLLCRQPFYIVYHPLSNPAFDALMYRMRSRFGAKLLTMTNAYKGLRQLDREGPVLSAFVADQSPPPAGAAWTEFLHQNTPFFRGPEKISAKLGQTVLYLSIQRVKRGYYSMHVQALADNPAGQQPGAVTEKYARVLEQDIITEPNIWLWSHRRWKHKHPLQPGTGRPEKTQVRPL